MWKVGDTIWILNKRGVLKKGTVVSIRGSYRTGEAIPTKVRTVGGVYCEPWDYDTTPDRLIEWIRQHAETQLRHAENHLEIERRAAKTLEARIQAMLDEAEGPKK